MPPSTAHFAPDGPRLDREHLVELYESDEFLVDSVCGFVEPALLAGDPVIVVATAAHREKFTTELAQRGLDVSPPGSHGQFISLDAAETLDRFMVGERPDPTRFAETLGPMIAQAAGATGRVRVYGEMVALLWADGNTEAAVALERLWNDLAATHPFSLLCAYPVVAVARASSTAPFRAMCREHTRVIPTESYSKLDDRDDQLYALALLQQEAAAATAESSALRAQQTQLVAAAREVAAARDEAIAASRATCELMTALTREMRTAAEAVVDLTARLVTTPLTDDQRLRVEGAGAAGRALLGAVDDVANFSELEAGLAPQVGALDLGRLVEEVRQLMAQPARQRGLDLVASCDAALPLVRRGDAVRLRRVLVHLVAHALEVAGKGAVVVRALPANDGQVHFEVAETGSGTSPADLDRVFGGFVEDDPSSTGLPEGAMVGLSISRRLVEAMGGRTGVASRPGRGSTAWFTVPLPVDWFGVPLPTSTTAPPPP